MAWGTGCSTRIYAGWCVEVEAKAACVTMAVDTGKQFGCARELMPAYQCYQCYMCIHTASFTPAPPKTHTPVA